MANEWVESNIGQQYVRRKQASERGCVCLNEVLKNTYQILQKLQKAADPSVSGEERDELVSQLQTARTNIKESMNLLLGSIEIVEDSKAQVEEIFRHKEFIPPLPSSASLLREKEELQKELYTKNEQIRKATLALRELQSDLVIFK